MRLVAFILSAILGSCSVALAQGNPSAEPRATTGSSSSTSGSGTSTSGGKDLNMDGGRDKMPESNMAVKPSPRKPDIPSPTGK